MPVPDCPTWIWGLSARLNRVSQRINTVDRLFPPTRIRIRIPIPILHLLIDIITDINTTIP